MWKSTVKDPPQRAAASIGQPGSLPVSERGLRGSHGPDPELSTPSRAVLSHAHSVGAGRTVGAGLEQGEQQEEWDAGCGEHPCPP